MEARRDEAREDMVLDSAFLVALSLAPAELALRSEQALRRGSRLAGELVRSRRIEPTAEGALGRGGMSAGE